MKICYNKNNNTINNNNKNNTYLRHSSTLPAGSSV